MPNIERDNHKAFEQGVDQEALNKAAEQGRERIAEQLERRSPESRPEKATHELSKEAAERAVSHEKEVASHEKQADTPERARRAPATKREQAKAFDNVMDEARSHMSPAERTFSKVIHNPAVEKMSEVLGKTVARPNAILSGSITAFAMVLLFFLVARYYGYPLSGAETIFAFIIGWVLGTVYDFLRTMITGGRSA